MIHVITIHFQRPQWIDLQLAQLAQHLSSYKVWTYLDGIKLDTQENKFHFATRSGVSARNGPSFGHWGKLNKLTGQVANNKETQSNDILLWLDSDAFPVAPLSSFIEEKLQEFPFIAVQRPENNGDTLPHPSFAVTTVGFWKEHGLSWAGQAGRAGSRAKRDTGGKLLSYFTTHNIPWYPLRRTASLTPHKVWFTIYDNLIYHHGAGSRKRLCRVGNKQLKGTPFNATIKLGAELSFIKKELLTPIADGTFDWNHHR